MSNSNNKGFTLIELLVVIAIIGLLASIVLVSLNTARSKARDARKQADFHSISLALQMFYDEKGHMPSNYNPCCGACEPQTYYNQSMQELIDAGFLTAIPKSPGGGGYCYYNYGAGNPIGAIIVTTLETYPASTEGLAGSCRPFGANWCSNINPSSLYCICNPY